MYRETGNLPLPRLSASQYLQPRSNAPGHASTRSEVSTQVNKTSSYIAHQRLKSPYISRPTLSVLSNRPKTENYSNVSANFLRVPRHLASNRECRKVILRTAVGSTTVLPADDWQQNTDVLP